MGTPNAMAEGPRALGGRAQTLALQGLVNRGIRALLRTPVLGRMAGRRLITVYVVGRKTGRRYVVPVAYARHDGAILIGTEFPWVRNLRTGDPVEIRLHGRRRPAQVRVLTDQAGVVEHFAALARDNHQWAKFNGIALDEDGNPQPDDLNQAWAAGGRAVLLTPQ